MHNGLLVIVFGCRVQIQEVLCVWQSVYITASGAWKLAGFGFAVNIGQPDPSSGPTFQFSVHVLKCSCSCQVECGFFWRMGKNEDIFIIYEDIAFLAMGSCTDWCSVVLQWVLVDVRSVHHFLWSFVARWVNLWKGITCKQQIILW